MDGFRAGIRLDCVLTGEGKTPEIAMHKIDEVEISQVTRLTGSTVLPGLKLCRLHNR